MASNSISASHAAGYPFSRTLSGEAGTLSLQTRGYGGYLYGEAGTLSYLSGEAGTLSLQTRGYGSYLPYYLAVIISPDFREVKEVARSFDGENWNAFVIRVLDTLSASDNDVVRSCVKENRATWLREAGVSEKAAPEEAAPKEAAPEEAAPEEDAQLKFLIQLRDARLAGDHDAFSALCDSFKGPDGEYPN